MKEEVPTVRVEPEGEDESEPVAACGDSTMLCPEAEGKTVDERIALFRKTVVEQKSKVDAKALLKKFFAPHEMSNLWNKFKRALAHPTTSAEVKKEWATITSKTVRDGKNDAKNSALMMQLAYPREWQDRWVHEIRRVTNTKSHGTETRRLYRGELEQLHGAREAQEFIAKGKYEEMEDSDGDICYRKVQKVEKDTKSYTNEAEVRGSCRVADDEKSDVILSAMDQWFNGGTESATLDGKVRKRPASVLDGGLSALVGNTEDSQPESGAPEAPARKDPNEECRSSAKKMVSSMGMTSGTTT